MTNYSEPERRFKEGSGERYLRDGRMRCHAIAKSRLREWREEFNDTESPAEVSWPETQCRGAAVEGFYVCKWHGGSTPRVVNPPRSILDVLPDDMAAKYAVLMQNPDYISRKEDILLFKARQWQLLEELEKQHGGEEAWGMVAEGLNEIKLGNQVTGIGLLEDALESTHNIKEIWKEQRENEAVIKDLTNTQVKTAKELKSMATYDQVMNMMINVFNVILEKANNLIEDPIKRDAFIAEIGREFGRFNNPSATILIEQTTE